VNARVYLAAEAEAQLNAISAWCKANSSELSTTLLAELEQALILLARTPSMGQPFLRATRQGVRRLLLRRSQHWLYYVHQRNRAVYILAIWSTARGTIPPLVVP
jgi:plasmid stabilization system protein ParE